MLLGLYNLIYIFALPLVILRLFVKSLKNKDYRQRVKERLSIFNFKTDKATIWLHAVSLGEVVAATPLIKAIIAKYPDYKIVVTCTTPTGSNQIQKTFKDTVFHVYAPFDINFLVKKFLKKIKPKMAIFMETEIWPNYINECKKRNIKLFLANARLSPKSFNSYFKYKKYTAHFLNMFNKIMVQSRGDYDRFLQLGIDNNKVMLMGNVKYDCALKIIKDDNLTTSLKDRKVWIAASTHSGEDEIILKAHKKILEKFKDALLIIVPRHVERFNSVAKLIADNDLICIRRTEGNYNLGDAQVFLGDTMGEMGLFYSLSDVALVAGSFANIGGHNLLEPASLGKPVLSGPVLHNFKEISEKLLQENALIIVKNSQELSQEIIRLFNDKNLSSQLGSNGLKVVADNKGAVDKFLAQLSHYEE